MQIDAQIRPSFRKVERSEKIELKKSKLDIKLEAYSKMFRSVNRDAFIQIPIYHKNFYKSGVLAYELFQNKAVESKMKG